MKRDVETQGDPDDALSNAWDYQGRPASRSRTGGWVAAAMILGTEGNERLTTLGVAVNMVTYMTGVMHLGNATAANSVTNFMGTSFMLCLFGGFIADTFLGRYLTIAIFACFQALGATVLTISTIIPSLRPPPCTPGSDRCVKANGIQMGVLYLALYLLALGTGGVKSSVSGFGSDQFDDTNPEERARMSAFFSWFFFFINIGALAAVTILVFIEDDLGRRWGYGICVVAILIGIGVFLSGTKRYRFKRLVGSPITQIASVVAAAWHNRGLRMPADPATGFFDVDQMDVDPKTTMVKEKLPRSKQYRFLEKAAIKDASIPKPTKWQLATLTDVEEVKMVLKMLPIWATTIIFWTIYAQMTTLSVSQATTMDRHMGPHFEIPAASLTAFFVTSILLTVPIYDSLISPVLIRGLRRPDGITPLQRIGVGLVLSMVAMVAAALTELKRLRVAHTNSADPKAIVPITVFWLSPQFVLVGAGDAFTYIGQLDFFLKECPKGMKTISTGLFLTTISLGFFLSTILVNVVHMLTGDKHPWIANNLNQGRLYNFYWMLAGLSLVNLGVFLYFARRYVYKEKWLAEAEGFGDHDDYDSETVV